MKGTEEMDTKERAWQLFCDRLSSASPAQMATEPEIKREACQCLKVAQWFEDATKEANKPPPAHAVEWTAPEERLALKPR